MPFPTDTVKKAFRDELEKISFTRTGRKPIGIEKLQERETDPENTPTNVFSEAKTDPEVFKKDVEKLSTVAKHLVGAGIGAATALTLQKANQDRKMGRAMRLQQTQGF